MRLCCPNTSVTNVCLDLYCSQEFARNLYLRRPWTWSLCDLYVAQCAVGLYRASGMYCTMRRSMASWCWTSHRYMYVVSGKIQGDGRKFLDRFKSYFGSQISSQSLNEIHICRYPQQKVSFSFMSLIVSSSRLMLPFDVWPSFPVTTWTLPYADFGKIIVLTMNVLILQFFSSSFSAVFNCRSLFNEAAYLAALRRLRSPSAIRDADSKQSKTKIYEENYLLLRISTVFGRFGPHVMIVMIFVTPNNF